MSVRDSWTTPENNISPTINQYVNSCPSDCNFQPDRLFLHLRGTKRTSGYFNIDLPSTVHQFWRQKTEYGDICAYMIGKQRARFHRQKTFCAPTDKSSELQRPSKEQKVTPFNSYDPQVEEPKVNTSSPAHISHPRHTSSFLSFPHPGS